MRLPICIYLLPLQNAQLLQLISLGLLILQELPQLLDLGFDLEHVVEFAVVGLRQLLQTLVVQFVALVNFEQFLEHGLQMHAGGDSFVSELCSFSFHLLDSFLELAVLHLHDGDVFKVVDLLLLLVLQHQLGVVSLLPHALQLLLEVLERQLVFHRQVFLEDGVLLRVIEVLFNSIMHVHYPRLHVRAS